MVRTLVYMAAGPGLCLLVATSIGCNAEQAADLALKSSDPERYCARNILREVEGISEYFEVANRDPLERARIIHERARAIPTEACAPEVRIAWAEVLGGLEMRARLDPGQSLDSPAVLRMEREQMQRANEFVALLAKTHPDLIKASDHPQALPAQTGDAGGAQAWDGQDPAARTVVATPSPPAPSAPMLQPFLSREGLYVPAGDAEVLTITVNSPTQLKLLLHIEGDAPLDVLFLPGQVSRGQWLLDAVATDMAAPFELMAGGSPDARFQGALSKRAAFRTFESEWGTAPPGDYTIVLDNTVAFTPERGDVVVKLDVYSSE